jgi:hypothetical protein
MSEQFCVARELGTPIVVCALRRTRNAMRVGLKLPHNLSTGQSALLRTCRAAQFFVDSLRCVCTGARIGWYSVPIRGFVCEGSSTF